MRQTITFVTDPETGKVYPIPAGASDDDPPGNDNGDPPGDGSDDPPGSDDLGEAGKKALAEERAARKAAEKEAKRAKELEAELAKFREDAMSEQEKALDQARKEAAEQARTETLTAANTRIAKAEAKALAAGKTRDPDVAVQLLGDLSVFVDEDGEVDTDAMSAALDALIVEKEYLAVGDRRQVPGGDQGARGGNGAKQLSRDDLKTMTPDEILKAQNEGRMDKILGRT